MRKTADVVIRFIFVAMTAVFLFSCSSSNNIWKTDLEDAKVEAQKEGKDIFLLFSTDDVESECDSLKKEVFYNKKFEEAMLDNFVLLDVFISESDYQKTLSLDDESLSDKERKEAQEIKASYNKKIAYLESYMVLSMPSMLILTKDGYVISNINYDPAIKTVDEYLSLITSFDEKRQNRNNLITTIEDSTALDKVYAIDKLVTETENDYRPLLIDYIREVGNIDTDNSSGLLETYDFLEAYIDGRALFRAGKSKEASEQFIKAIEKGHFSSTKIQEAYYTASQILAYSNKYDDNIMKYLELAYDIDKDSSVASEIKYTIDALKKLFETDNNALQQKQN
ncbi:MAG: thioredoxin family protein [Treponema sp.]|nr:thioredoxin family protein [Treponema sp.]